MKLKLGRVRKYFWKFKRWQGDRGATIRKFKLFALMDLIYFAVYSKASREKNYKIHSELLSAYSNPVFYNTINKKHIFLEKSYLSSNMARCDKDHVEWIG